MLSLALLFLSIIILIYFFLHNSFQYWNKKGIPVVKPSFPAGNIGPVFSQKENFGHFLQRLYNELKTKGSFGGFYMFSTPALLVCDTERIKDMFVKDFNHFQDRGMYYNEKEDPISAHLFSIEGEKWKNLRKKFSPTFTSGKLKNMFPIILDCSKQLEQYLSEYVVDNNVLEIKDTFAKFTIDIIGSVAFGIDCNSLKNPDSKFRKIGLKVFAPTFRENINHALGITYKNLAKKLNLITHNKSVSKFFLKLTSDIVTYREANNVNRSDFIDLLIQLKNTGTLDGSPSKTEENPCTRTTPSLTMNEISAQVFIFFVAGYETSSSTMSFCLFELAQHQDVQERVRQEINKVFKGKLENLTYDGLLELTYLDAVINETMRKYPPVPMLTRECTKDYILPKTETIISKGTMVFIPVRGLHYDPEIFPNPEQFDPERFTKENISSRHHFSYLPFGEGPRNCIGLRLAMMMTRLGLVTMLSNYKWTLSDKTTIPLEINPISFVTNSIGGIWLKYEAI